MSSASQAFLFATWIATALSPSPSSIAFNMLVCASVVRNGGLAQAQREHAHAMRLLEQVLADARETLVAGRHHEPHVEAVRSPAPRCRGPPWQARGACRSP
jgi:hypothetical protein